MIVCIKGLSLSGYGNAFTVRVVGSMSQGERERKREAGEKERPTFYHYTEEMLSSSITGID